MKRMRIGLAILGAVAVSGLAPTSLTLKAAPAVQVQNEKPRKTESFHGKVEATDISARTLTVGGQLIYITDATKLTRNDEAIILADIMVGEEARGTTRQTFDGKTEALTVKVGNEQERK